MALYEAGAEQPFGLFAMGYGETANLADVEGAAAPPSADPSPSPRAIMTPNRVETGGGGTAQHGHGALLAGVALAVGLVIAAAARTRASAA